MLFYQSTAPKIIAIVVDILSYTLLLYTYYEPSALLRALTHTHTQHQHTIANHNVMCRESCSYPLNCIFSFISISFLLNYKPMPNSSRFSFLCHLLKFINTIWRAMQICNIMMTCSDSLLGENNMLQPDK